MREVFLIPVTVLLVRFSGEYSDHVVTTLNFFAGVSVFILLTSAILWAMENDKAKKLAWDSSSLLVVTQLGRIASDPTNIQKMPMSAFIVILVPLLWAFYHLYTVKSSNPKRVED